jgi:hypothetical protein
MVERAPSDVCSAIHSLNNRAAAVVDPHLTRQLDSSIQRRISVRSVGPLEPQIPHPLTTQAQCRDFATRILTDWRWYARIYYTTVALASVALSLFFYHWKLLGWQFG